MLQFLEHVRVLRSGGLALAFQAHLDLERRVQPAERA
jgi:hypothetical protein